MKIISKKIDDLLASEYNPRKDLQPNDLEYKSIKNSIEKFGYVQPIILNSNNVVVGGNQRLKVLKELGYKNVECVLVDLDENEEKALNIALNKIDGVWDDEKLKNILNDLHKVEFDLNFTGFNPNELDDLLEGFDLSSGSTSSSSSSDNFNEKEALEEIEDVKTKKGNLYKLGNHWLLCGDSFNEVDRKKLIKDNSFDMLLTDPPYATSTKFNSSNEFGRSMKNMEKRTNDITDFDVDKLKFIKDIDAKSFYIYTAKGGVRKLLNTFHEFNYDILVWCKTNSAPLTNNNYVSDVEYLLNFYTKKNKRIWNNSLKPTNVYKKYYISKQEEGRNEDGDLHPTMKPLEMLINRLRVTSKKEGNVIDFFGGSGSTLIACEKIKRHCFTMELDPKYCDVIINRYIKYKGSSDDVYLIQGNRKTTWKKYIEK